MYINIVNYDSLQLFCIKDFLGVTRSFPPYAHPTWCLHCLEVGMEKGLGKRYPLLRVDAEHLVQQVVTFRV